VANQTAVGLKKAELIERLTAGNIVRDMFDALAAGSVEAAEAKADEAECDLDRQHLFLHCERRSGENGAAPAWPVFAQRLERELETLRERRRAGVAGVRAASRARAAAQGSRRARRLPPPPLPGAGSDAAP